MQTSHHSGIMGVEVIVMPIRGGKAYRQLCGCGLGEVCGRHWAMVTQLDVAHVVPFKEGGLSTPDNMRVVCHPCNKREGYGTQNQPAIR